MNLKEIREEINSALDYNPALSAYKSQVDRIINRHYMQCSGQYQWLFMQEKSEINVKATVSGSANSTATISAANLRKVTNAGSASGVFIAAMEGQTFVAPDGTEAIIVRVSSTTILFLDRAVTAATTDSNWSIRFDRYALPRDCVEVLGVMSRNDDRGRIMFINMRKEEEHFLDKDITGDPIVMIEDESNEIQRPPEQTIRLTVKNTGSSNALESNVTYQYCYTIVSEGIESSPSLTSEATTTTSDMTIQLQKIENLQWSSDGTTFVESGKRKYLYRRDKTNGTRWIRIAILDAATVDYVDDTILPSASSGTSTYDYDQVEGLFDAGPRQFVRMWWTASTDLALEIRYAQRPRRLSADYDVPIWPTHYHHYLVYKPLEDICMQHGMTTQSQLYGRRAEELLKRMRQKYLSRANRMLRRRGFDKDLVQTERFGVPTKV
tara:strand:- start:325 stop:1635 length:1311 start_codon:yes stop_codon:yes gene_type:complete